MATIEGIVTAGSPETPVELKQELNFRYQLIVGDYSLAISGIFPGDCVLVATWMLDMWSMSRFLEKPVVMVNREKGTISLGWYRCTHLLQGDKQLPVTDEMEIIGVIEALYREL